MKLRWNNKLFPLLNFIIGKPAPCRIKDILRHYNYRSYSKIGPVITATRRILCSWHACTTKSSLPGDYKTKDACNQLIYRIVYNYKYFLIIGSHNNWVIMNFIDYGTDNVDYKYMNRAIFDGNVMNISLIIAKENYGAID